MPLRGSHALSFIRYYPSDNCSSDPFHRRTGERNIRLRLDGVVYYGLLRRVYDRCSLGECGIESNSRICQPFDDLLACQVEGVLTRYKGRCGKYRERESECEEW